MVTWEGHWQLWSWGNSRYYPSNCLEGPWKTIKTLR